ncbi:hypothetical protein JCM10213_004731 [Rhodosporidiobolus nylandii]
MSFTDLTFDPYEFTRDGRERTRRDPFDYPRRDDDSHSSINLKLLAILLPTLATVFLLLLLLLVWLKVRGVKKRVEREKAANELRDLEHRERELVWHRDGGGERHRDDEWKYPPLCPPPVYGDPYDHRRHHHGHGHRHRDEHHHRRICMGRRGCDCGCGR